MHKLHNHVLSAKLNANRIIERFGFDLAFRF